MTIEDNKSESTVAILTELQQRGVLVAVKEDTLILKPKSALDDALLARVREAKPAILETQLAEPRLLDYGAEHTSVPTLAGNAKTESLRPPKIRVTSN